MELTIDFLLTTGQLWWQAIVGSLRAPVWDNKRREERSPGRKHTHTWRTHRHKFTFVLTTIRWDCVKVALKGGVGYATCSGTRTGFRRNRRLGLFCEAGKSQISLRVKGKQGEILQRWHKAVIHNCYGVWPFEIMSASDTSRVTHLNDVQWSGEERVCSISQVGSKKKSCVRNNSFPSSSDRSDLSLESSEGHDSETRSYWNTRMKNKISRFIINRYLFRPLLWRIKLKEAGFSTSWQFEFISDARWWKKLLLFFVWSHNRFSKQQKPFCHLSEQITPSFCAWSRGY